MIDLGTSVEKLPGVGPRNVSRLARLGITTVRDLVRHFPIRYENYQETSLIADIIPGNKVNVQGEILNISNKHIFPRRLHITTAVIRDSSGAMKVTWFNQPYIEQQLPEGTLVSLAGKVTSGINGVYLSSPTYEKISFTGMKHTTGLVPIYPETDGITSKYLRFLIKPLLEQISIPDALPESLIEKYHFPPLGEALSGIHYPATLADAEKAKERFAFEDLLLFQIKSLLERRKMNQLKSIVIPFDESAVKSFVSSLPFQLTADQKIAAFEILKDLEKSYPMNRLLEGDVGSGKTVVALIGSVGVARSGYQVAFLAPTEVLAQQHYGTIRTLLSRSDIHTGLLTASTSLFDDEPIKKIDLKKEIAHGSIHIIVGTHAVIQKDVDFKKLALVIVDEQHRFGIEQRAALIKKDMSAVPHLLSMTATPIPRTLALTIYGDLDLSLIKEKPANRQKIITRIIQPSLRNQAYQFITTEVAKGRQVFVICPRIELSDPQKPVRASAKQQKMNMLWAEVKAVEEEYKKLSEQIFPHLRVAMLHGKLKPLEKQRIMTDFKNKKYNILVSTSVIEVGVDVPNATVMMIESAERFGLAQLHQFRGRVGRSEHQSHCLLLTSANEKTTNQRLKALVDSDDGFVLAEKDMKLRGPGEFFGVKQSGMPDLAMASLTNVDLIKKSRAEARALLKEDASLKAYPLLKQRLEDLRRMVHFE